MDYSKIYADFIANRRLVEPDLVASDQYRERHHILPVSLGGRDEPANLICLTARDHYFAHCCLAKIHGGKMWSALFAVAAMTKVDKASAYFLQGPMVAIAREKAAAERSENMAHLWKTGQFTRNREYGPLPDAQKKKIGDAHRGKRWSKQRSRSVSEARQRKCKAYSFQNIETGETFQGSQSMFSRHAGIGQSLASCLTRGKIGYAKGWVIQGSNPQAVRGRDATLRVFENKDGRRFVGTMYQLRTQFSLDAGVITNLVKGKNGVKSIKGWRYVGLAEGHGAS